MEQEKIKSKPPAPRTLKEFLSLLWLQIVAQRRWALVPVWILLALLGLLLVLSGNSHLLPAIYIAF